MFNINNNYYLKIIILGLSLILTRYLVSFYYNVEESLFFKIVRLGEIDFTLYSLIAESISRIDFYTDWNELEPANKIIGFPIFSILWHSIFYAFFNHYGFLVAEIVIYCFLIFLIFKTFLFLSKKIDEALLITVLLFLFLEFLTFLNFNLNFNILRVLKLPIYEFISYRFPRPLVTSTYLFFVLFFIQKINDLNFNKINYKYLLFLGIFLSFLINSFFYLFLSCFLTIIIFFFYKSQKNILFHLKNNFINIIIFCLPIIFGFLVLLIQTNLAEDSYANRIGAFNVNLNDKILILKVFFKKLFQLEILLIILLSSFFRFLKIAKLSKIQNSRFDIFLILFIASLISPFIFTIFSSKIISLYHFWTLVKFFGFLYIFICTSTLIISIKFYNKKALSSLFLIILISLNLINDLTVQQKIDKKLVNDREEIQQYLINNNYINTNKLFYTDENLFIHLWLQLKNKNFINPYAFISSQSDLQFENVKMNMMKFLNYSNKDFLNLLNQEEDDVLDRNRFAMDFNYKYSVNSVRHYKPLSNEYSKEMQERIMNISPLLQWYTFFPNSEKERLIKKFKNFEIDSKLVPNFFILRNNKHNQIYKKNIINKGFKEEKLNSSYILLFKT
tara:strand:+ start:257 stop:2107 length:1851 start_codon:yes stop_codon:yes gene_type:complete